MKDPFSFSVLKRVWKHIMQKKYHMVRIIELKTGNFISVVVFIFICFPVSDIIDWKEGMIYGMYVVDV